MGGVRGQWVEEGGVRTISGWMGGVSDKAESEGGVGRRVGDEGRWSQKARNAEQEKTTTTDDGQHRDPSFSRSCGAGEGDDPKRCVVT